MNRVGHSTVRATVASIFLDLVARVRDGFERRRSSRRLRLQETLSLGEKRFLAVVQFQQQEFLVGGTGNSIALLARLDAPRRTPDPSRELKEAGF